MIGSITFPSIEDSPDVVLAYYSSPPVEKLNTELQTKFALTGAEKIENLRVIEADLLIRELLPEDLPARLNEVFGLEQTKALELARLLWQDFCGPIDWLFPDFTTKLNKLGEKISVSTLPKIAQPVITIAAAVEDLISLVDETAMANSELQIFLAKTLQAKDFDEDVIFEKLTTFGLAEEVADELLFELRNYVAAFNLQMTDINSLPKNILAPNEQAQVVGKITAANKVAAQPITNQQQAIVAAVLTMQPLTGYSEEIQTRWRLIVEARVKGVRDATQTRATINGPVANGGLGLNQNDADSCVTVLEKAVAGFENKRSEFSVIEKMQSVTAVTAHLARDPDEEQKTKQKELNERFVTMFGRRAVEEMRSETHREIQTAAAAHPKEHIGTPAPILATAGTLGPSTTTTQPLAAVPNGPPKYVPKVPEKLKQLIEAENPVLPKRVSTKFGVSVVSDISGAPGSQLTAQKVSDIKPSTRLLGPIDELRTMSVIDWRRLSPDPSVRIQKIRSKIEVIAADGPAEKLKALDAFEQSEPARVYREILKQALLTRKTPAEVAAERKVASEMFLDETEQEEIKKFLQQIRYSSI